MDLSVDEAKYILNASKVLVKPMDWVSVPNRNHVNPQREVKTRVSIDGAIKRGIFFRIRLYPSYPQTMTFQLEVDQAENRTHISLYRLDVCPMSSHANIIEDKRELSGLFFKIGETHEHVITDNLKLDNSRILSQSDRYARKITSPPENFSCCVNYICDRINIGNGEDIPPPSDQGLLL